MRDSKGRRKPAIPELVIENYRWGMWFMPEAMVRDNLNGFPLGLCKELVLFHLRWNWRVETFGVDTKTSYANDLTSLPRPPTEAQLMRPPLTVLSNNHPGCLQGTLLNPHHRLQNKLQSPQAPKQAAITSPVPPQPQDSVSNSPVSQEDPPVILLETDSHQKD